MIFKQPVEVWLDHLGVYDPETGVQIGGNGGVLNGKYGNTELAPLNPPLPRVASSQNDFRIDYLGSGVGLREGILWSSEAQFYHDVNRYRAQIFNDSFIETLNLPPEIKNNVLNRQFRPDLDKGQPPVMAKPTLRVRELYTPLPAALAPIGNVEDVGLRTRGSGYENLPPLSDIYDSEFTLGDFAGLMAFWVLGSNRGFPPEDFFGETPGWQTNMLPALNDGLSAWVGHRFTGETEVYKYAYYAVRVWAGRTCGGTNIPCDRGENLRNVMMFDEANTSRDGVFPFTSPSGKNNLDGPVGSDFSALFIAAIFYDIAYEAGLDAHKADLLMWKSISLITNNATFPMRAYGATVQQAARALWPDPRPGRSGLSLYEEDIVDVLTSRGIPMNGVSDFRTNLPPVIGLFPATLEFNGPGFGSGHPDAQPSVNFYGNYNVNWNHYTDPASNATYIAYQFYKHSKYGPCDKLVITDGTFTTTSTAPFAWSYNNDGTFYTELADRDLGNVVVMLPGHSLRFLRSRQRCPNESTGYYVEDVRPFGFRVIKATPNGFSFTASALSETVTNKTYQLTIVDPSTNTLGTASYAWNFTNHVGTATAASGSTVQYTALKDEPFTINITRTRASQTDTLTLRERGNDLDRNGGNAFVRNLIP